MSKEFQMKEGNLVASFDLENEDGDVDCCKLYEVSKDVANQIKMFVDYDAITKIIDGRNQLIADLQHQLKVAEKALELACEPRDDWGGEKYSGTEYDNYYDYFMAEAKEMMLWL